MEQARNKLEIRLAQRSLQKRNSRVSMEVEVAYQRLKLAKWSHKAVIVVIILSPIVQP